MRMLEWRAYEAVEQAKQCLSIKPRHAASRSLQPLLNHMWTQFSETIYNDALPKLDDRTFESKCWIAHSCVCSVEGQPAASFATGVERVLDQVFPPRRSRDLLSSSNIVLLFLGDRPEKLMDLHKLEDAGVGDGTPVVVEASRWVVVASRDFNKRRSGFFGARSDDEVKGSTWLHPAGRVVHVGPLWLSLFGGPLTSPSSMRSSTT